MENNQNNTNSNNSSSNISSKNNFSPNIISQEKDEFISDDWIFSSEAFDEGDDYTACFGYFQQIFVEVKTAKNKFKINTRMIKHPDNNPKRKTILFTHGHSTEANWVTWIKTAVFLFNCDFDIIMIDLPGFGRSLINGQTKVHFKNWLEDGPNMIQGLLKSLNISKVSCCGYCGGAALLIRTIAIYPWLFNTNHIFYNLIIGAIPDNFDKLISKYKMNIIVLWKPDEDHPTYSVAYKWLKNQTKNKNANIKLIDLKSDDLLASQLWAKGYGRSNSDYLFIFLPSIKFVSFANSFYDENVKDYPID
jgi:pimeloyl-ACP methyl ester carboxylesterase